MYSRLNVVVLVAAALAGVFAMVAPASNVNRGTIEEVPGLVDRATYAPWADPAEGALGSDGIETDLDGNASALKASDVL